MGNEFTKHFRSDDGYELNLTVKKVPLSDADQNGTTSAHTGTENENEEEPRVRSGRKRSSAEPGTPSSTKALKNAEGRPKKLAVDSSGAPGGAAGDETPRGRRSTCVTIGDTENPSLDIQIIKSHLSPNYVLTLPAEFVKKHLKDNQAYDVVNGGVLRVIKHSPSRYTLEKKFWQGFVQENNLGLKDGLHVELVGESLFRIDIFKAPPEAIVAEEGGAAAAAAAAADQDVKTGEATSAPADQAPHITANLADAQQC